MSVKIIISDILKKRHDKVTELEVVRRDFDGLETTIENLLKLAQGERQIPTESISVTSSVCNKLNGLQEEISDIQSSVSNLIKRFKRETVNVGVAGKARQGKSTLLQSISGLTKTEIPTSDELPCTGAKSKIFHSEGQPYAKIDFYTENEFLKEIIHAYFERLNLPKASSLENFSKPLPPPNDKEDTDRNLYNAVYERLKMIHNAFPAFRDYLSKPSEIVELKQISDYVTQSDGRSKYLAVKTANIYTKFPHHDVSGLCLVDLPGLEAAQGHEKKLVDSLENEVDAVILVKLPSAQGTQYDKDDYKVIDLIDHAVREVDLADWLFIILNVLSDKSNEKQAQLLKTNPPQTSRRFNILIGDCSDPKQAEEKVFSPVLNHLEQNLEKIDRKLIKAVSEKMRGISERLTDTLRDSKEQLKPQQEDRRIQREYERLVLEFTKDMKRKIADLTAETRNNMAALGSEFNLKIEEICKLAEEKSLIPPVEELKKRCQEERGWSAAVQYELHYIRSAISKFLADKIDEYLREQVNNALRKVLDGIFKASVHSILPSPPDNADPFETVKEIQKLFDPYLQPQLYGAFDYIAKFNFSYHSHFHHRVRENMSLLDTYDNSFVKRIIPEEINNKRPDNPLEIAEDIERGLQVSYKETVYGIRKKLGEEMQTDPANAIFSLVEEIEDRLVRQKDIEFEWRDFLYQVRSRMWPETFGQFDQYAAFCRDWQSSADDVLKSIQQVKGEFGKIAG